MKKIFIALLFFLTGNALYSQITFEKIFTVSGESIANDVRQTNDGGYIIAGTTDYSYMSSGDILLIRMTQQGDTIWTRTYGGFAAEMGNSVLETMDGGFIVAGSTNSYGAGGSDAYLIKTDAFGNIEWSKTIGTVGNDEAYGLVETADSGYVFSGNELTYGINGYAHLVKTDKNGNVVWSQTYGNNMRKNYVFALEQTNDNGFILGGYENNYISTNDEFSLIKTDSLGNMQWYKSYGDLYYDHNFSVCEALDGGFAIAGINFELAGYNYDVNLVKTDVNGNLQWTKSYGGSGHEDVYAITATSDSGFVFAGSSSSFSGYQNGYMAKTDANGNIVWNTTTPGTGYDIFFSARETSDGGFVFAGVKDEIYGVSGDLFVVKTDANGNTPCSTPVSGYTITPPTIVGTLLMHGSSSPVVSIQTPQVGSGAMMTSLCCEAPGGLSTGPVSINKAVINWTVEPGAIQYEVWYKRATAAGWKIKFVPGDRSKLTLKNLKCNKSYQWQIRTICDTVGIDQVSGFSVLQTFTTSPCRGTDITAESDMIVYPNPATNQITIYCNISGDPSSIGVYILDMNGRIMYGEEKLLIDGELNETINTEDFPAGMYIVKVVSDEETTVQQVMIIK